MKSLGALCIFIPAAAGAAVLTMDSAQGEMLFQSLSCAQCHAVNGTGGRVGPDLGRLIDRNFTPTMLCSTMWNHAPAMWTAMGQRGIQPGAMDEQGAADLFAYFASARFFEKPGEAERGKRLFTEKGCSGCHGLTKPLASGAPPVSEWDGLTDPVTLAQTMWNHAPGMLKATAAKHMAWPGLAGQDLTDLLVYLRNLPGVAQKPSNLQTTAGTNGEVLFRSKGCIGCHGSASVLSSRLKGLTLTEVAAAMWDHAPRMSAASKSAPLPQFNTEEMRELLSYLWARQFFQDSGNASHGSRVFAAKRCTSCHGVSSSGAPDLTGAHAPFNGATMVSALWRHGPRMLQQMKQRGVPWPRFAGNEMADLIAYLNLHSPTGTGK
jgi:cytochrome c2